MYLYNQCGIRYTYTISVYYIGIITWHDCVFVVIEMCEDCNSDGQKLFRQYNNDIPPLIRFIPQPNTPQVGVYRRYNNILMGRTATRRHSEILIPCNSSSGPETNQLFRRYCPRTPETRNFASISLELQWK